MPKENVKSRPKITFTIPIGKNGKDIKFEDFYKKFNNPREIIETKEWREFYSHFYEFTDQELDIDIKETVADLEQYDEEQQAIEIEKCMDNFEYFCHKYVKILHAVHGTIPFITYKYQRRVARFYQEEKYSIVSKFRQGGLTTIATLFALWKCLFFEGQSIYLLSRTDREAMEAGLMIDRALENMPKWLWEKDANITKHEKVFGETKSRACFYTPVAIRGKTASLIIIDEAAFIEGMEDHWKSMYPVVATGGNVFVISTVNGLGNWYEETYHAAEAGKSFFKIIDLDYWEHPEYATPEWESKTKANMGSIAWKQEILRSFLGSGSTYIHPDIIADLDQSTRTNAPRRTLFEKWCNKTDEKRAEWDNGALWIWIEPIEGHEYLISTDVAEGVGEAGDNSSFQILDVVTMEQVGEFYSNTIPPSILAQILNQIGIYYNNALIVVENNTIGGSVVNALQHELGYENLFYEAKSKKPGIKVGANNRNSITECLQQRLIHKTVKINSRRLVNELKTFVYNASTKKAESQKRKHDDAIMSLCLGLYVRDTQNRNTPIGADVPQEVTSVFKTELYEQIKKEILEGAPEDMFGPESNDLLAWDNTELNSLAFNFRRANENLLREFGW